MCTMKALVLCLCFISVACTTSSQSETSGSQSPAPSPIEDDPVSTTFVYRLDTAAEKIYLASLDPATGGLHEHDATDLPSGSNPSSFTVTPDKKYMFVSAMGTGTIEAYSIDETSGKLTWLRSNNVYDFPAKRILVEPQGDFLLAVENSNIQGQSGGYLVSYAIANEVLTALNHTSMGQEADEITSDVNGDYIFVGSNDAGILAIAIDRTTNPGIPLFSKGALSGSFMNAFTFNSSNNRLFVANTINGDFNNVLILNTGTLGLSAEVTINGGQITPFIDVALNFAGNNLYFLSDSPAKVNSFAVTYGPTAISLLNSVSFSSGCAPRVMTFAESDGYFITACTGSSGQTYSLKIEADGSLTEADVSVRSGMKVNDILAIKF